MAGSESIRALTAGLPAHTELVDRLTRAVEGDDRWRWLELGCSLAAGRGDPLSDIDVGVGFAETLAPEGVEAAGVELIEAAGPVVEHLAHPISDRAGDIRLAVEYHSGVQLDLVLMPAANRPGLPAVSRAVVDKDGHLARPWTPTSAGPPSPSDARQWTMLGWWAISDATKYVRRGSLFEAVERIAEARTFALQLFATGAAIPYPSFGLTSLLDYPPYRLPDDLEQTYCPPVDGTEVVRSIEAVARLLATSADQAGASLGVTLATAWSDIARSRTAAARLVADG
jgi:hypothetical protein